MFFTRVGTVLAYLGFVLGVLRYGLSVYFAIATPDMAANAAAAKRYLAATNTGLAMDEGALLIVSSVALGVLCEISRRVGLRN